MFKSHSYQESARNGGRDRSALEATLAIVLAAAWTGFVAVLLMGPGPSRAQELEADFVSIEQASVGSPVDLERSFWLCDHAATTQAIGSDMAAVCSAVTEDLKRTKFGGDFAAMLAWWQQNKATEHAALDAANEEYPLP